MVEKKEAAEAASLWVVVLVFMLAVGLPFRLQYFLFVPAAMFIGMVQILYARNVSLLRRSMFVLEVQKLRTNEEGRGLVSSSNAHLLPLPGP